MKGVKRAKCFEPHPWAEADQSATPPPPAHPPHKLYLVPPCVTSLELYLFCELPFCCTSISVVFMSIDIIINAVFNFNKPSWGPQKSGIPHPPARKNFCLLLGCFLVSSPNFLLLLLPLFV